MANLLGGTHVYGNLIVDGGIGAGNLHISNSTPSTTTTSGALQVDGGVGIGGNLNIGTSTSLHTISGNLQLGNPTAGNYKLTVVSSDSNYALYTRSPGVQIVALDSGATVQQYVGYATSAIAYHGTGTNHPLAFITNNTNRLQVDAGGNILVGTVTPTTYSNLTVGHSTPSTSTTTGALVVLGGAGIVGNLNVGGNIVLTAGDYLVFGDGTSMSTAATGGGGGGATTSNVSYGTIYASVRGFDMI